jgi:glutathione S-transferase
MNQTPTSASLSWASLLRQGSGGRVASRLGTRPELPLELYEFETCPFCRKVREALSILDLEARIQPCPKRGERFRKPAGERFGREQFPYLVDPNTGVSMFESDDIVRYLFETYGLDSVPWPLSASGIGDLLAVAAGLSTMKEGTFAEQSRAPDQPLELYGYELSQDTQRVRARLCALELGYLWRPAAPGSERSAELAARGVDVPLLVDPNAGVEMLGAEAGLAHLDGYRLRG